jgi:hypothetical protein
VFVVALWFVCRVCYPGTRRGKCAVLFHSVSYIGVYCLRSGLHTILVTFVSCLLLKGKRIYLAEFDSEFIRIYLNKIFHKSTRLVILLRKRHHRLTAVLTFRNARSQMNGIYIWLAICVCVNRGVRSKSELRHTGNRLATSGPPPD